MLQARTLALLIFCVLVVTGCGPIEPPGREKMEITASDYGASWPLTVSKATLYCEQPGAVWIKAGDLNYPVNGTSKSYLPKKYPEMKLRGLESIWKLDHPGPRKNIGPLIDDGLALCGYP